jgi:uncharacterized protein
VNTTPETAGLVEPITSPAVSEVDLQTPSQPSPDNPPWGILVAVATWLMSMALLVVVPGVCVLPYLASKYKGTAATGDVLLKDPTYIFLVVISWLPAHLLTLALIWAVATRLGKISIKQVFGWNWGRNFGLATSIGLAVVLFFLTLLVIGWLGGQETDLDRLLKSSRATAVMLAIIAVATAPLVEEMIYRGLLYSAFQRVMGRWGAVAAVTTMFAGLHVVQYWPNGAAIFSITLLSLVLTMVRAQSGQLLPCFVVHLVFNGIQSVLIIIEPYIRLLFEKWQHEPVNAALALAVRWFN